MDGGNISMTGYACYSSNRAVVGGAISVVNSSALFRETNVTFRENMAALIGGGMHLTRSSLRTDKKGNITFVGNAAGGVATSVRAACGVMCIYNTGNNTATNSISATFVNNSGTQPGRCSVL